MNSTQRRAVTVFTMKMLASILVFSAIVGYFVFRNYLIFEREMLDAKATLTREGPSFSIEQCVDAVVGEVEHCTRMSVLCEQAVPRLMGSCLEGRDRKNECVAYVEKMGTAKLGYSQCAARGKVGRKHHSCGTAFQTFAEFCKDNYKVGT